MRQLFYSLCFLMMGLHLHCGGRSDQSEERMMKEENESSQTNGRILALGDSFTVGEGIDFVESYPMQLAQSLGDLGVDVGNPVVIARSGWTADDLLLALDNENLEGQFDLVTIMIGTNDQNNEVALEDFRASFKSILRTAILLTGNRPTNVLVLSIPDWGFTSYAKSRGRTQVSRGVEEYNRLIWNETVLAGAEYLDITKVYTLAETDPTYLASDGLHGSGRMYARWVEQIIPKVVGLFALD